MSGSSQRYLTAVLGDQAYGVAVPRIRDLRRVPSLHALPVSDPAVRGTFELRGRPALALDLRTRLGAPPALATHPCLLVVEAEPAGSPPVLLGLIVDTVEEVFCLGDCDPRQCPVMAAGPIVGECRVRGLRKQLLDVDQLVSAAEAAALPPLTGPDAA